MKSPSKLAATLTLTLATALLTGVAFAQNITPSLVPTGSSSLPQGQYMLTNMNTGQALYMEIDASGRLYAQDPRALSITANPSNTPNSTNSMQSNAYSQDNGAQTQGGSIWGGLLKRGMNSIINNQNQQPVGGMQ